MSKLILTKSVCDNLLMSALESSGFIGLTHQHVYGIPRGGIPVAYMAQQIMKDNHWEVTFDPNMATLIVDDIVDSGRTKARYLKKFPTCKFLSLIDKTEDGLNKPDSDDWYIFPWEHDPIEGSESSSLDIPIRLLQYIGEDVNRGGLLETPQRFLRAWDEWSSGYGIDPEQILKTFEDGAETYDEMVVVPGIPFYSHCEHHLAPFFGSVTIGYIPNKKIVGLSKFSRLVDVFSKRLQVQERMTTQIASTLNNALNPIGVGVFVEARHLCMESRGISKSCHPTKTQALFGKFRNDEKVRNEFLSLCKK